MTAPRVQGQGVTVRYNSAVPLESITFEFASGEYPVVVTGPSGSGKTTLLRVIAGAQDPDEGSITVDGETVSRPTWRSSGDLRVGFIHQDYRLVPFLTIGENMRLACEAHGKSDMADAPILESLEQVGLAEISLNRMPATLSGGQQQRVAIARAMAAGCSVLLADEPTGALDSDNTLRVAELLKEVTETRDIAVIIATHDSVVAARASTRYRMGGGRLCRAE